MTRIFISYRRLDSKWPAGRIYDRLSQVLEKENIFLDVSDIQPGEDYVERIHQTVGSCDALLVVIGRGWLTAKDNLGRRCLDNPDDWVRVEISAALNRGIRVIPILVDDAEMPEGHDLPDGLAALSRRNAKLVSFRNFHSDLDSLLRVLEKVLKDSHSLDSSGAIEIDGSAESVKQGPADSVPIPTTAELPLTISLETEGCVATPLIYCGDRLPAKCTHTFSTAADNQYAVTIRLSWGEAEMSYDNLLLGVFDFDVPPAPRGTPQIEISTDVNEQLTLTVTATNLETGRSQVVDAIDLSHVPIPEKMLSDAITKPRRRESKKDEKTIFNAFCDIFRTTNK